MGRTHVLPSGLSDDPRHRALLAFADDVLQTCDQIGLDPLLDGGLAVAAHTQDASLTVRDVDLNCLEDDFGPLAEALRAAGVFVEIQPWHVLQARRDGLKVEFGASDVWLSGLTVTPEVLDLNGRSVAMVDLATLVEQYRRGVQATDNDDERAKHAKNVARLRVIEAHARRQAQHG